MPFKPRARASRAAAALLALAALCAIAEGAAFGAAPPSGAPPAAASTPDSSLIVRTRAPDSTRAAPPPAPASDTSRVALPLAVDFEEQRKGGDASFEAAFRGRRPSLFMPLPLFGALTGSLSVPDGGSRLRPFPVGAVADAPTDRTLLAAKPYGVGLLDLATVLDNPRADGIETLDLTVFSRSMKPEPFDRAGALLAEPVVERAFTRVIPGEGRRDRRAKSALYYGNGDEGILDTGARFVSPSLGLGVGGSYARHEANGISPLHRAASTRYALAAGLPRVLRHYLWVEGNIFEWTVEDEADSVNPSTSAVETVPGRAEIQSRILTLHARGAGERLSRWTIRAGEAKRTRVRPDGSRERWEFPDWSLWWNGELKPMGGWTPVASLHGDSRRVTLATEGPPLFAPRREEARVGAGLRRSLGGGGGTEATVAVDWREASPTLTEGRLSTWADGSRASGRLDLELAHERPSWVDLLSPERVEVHNPSKFPGTTLRLTRSGDPSLEPRRLAGALAKGSYAVSRAIVVEAEGSVRRLDDDFGWDVARAETTDTLFVDVRAAPRGDGWVSHGSISLSVRPGPFRLRGLGWARGGPERLSPRAGSPPRYGADATAAVQVKFFQGDLPLELRFDLHADGPREGLVREPSSAVVTGSLRADFGAAGGFLEFGNLLDRSVASAVYDAAGDRAVPMPGRTFRFGFTWYLLD